MKKHHRNASGKAIKWRDTRYGRLNIARLKLLQKAMLYRVTMQTAAHIYSIQRTAAKTPEEKVCKGLAIANAIIGNQKSINSTLTLTKEWFGNN